MTTHGTQLQWHTLVNGKPQPFVLINFNGFSVSAVHLLLIIISKYENVIPYRVQTFSYIAMAKLHTWGLYSSCLWDEELNCIQAFHRFCGISQFLRSTITVCRTEILWLTFTWISELRTCHTCFFGTPETMTYCAPLTTNTDFNPTIILWYSTHQSYLISGAVLRGIWS